jgi:hypothetical protein
MKNYHDVYVLEEIMPLLCSDFLYAKEGPFSYEPSDKFDLLEGNLYVKKQQYTGENTSPVKLDIEKAQDIDELISRFNIFSFSPNGLSVASDTTLRLSRDDAEHLADGNYFISQRVSKKEHEGLLFIPHNEDYGVEDRIKNPWHLDCYVEQEDQYGCIGDVQIIGFHIVDMKRYPEALAQCSGYDSVESMKYALEEINEREIEPHSMITTYFLHDFQKRE